MTITRRDFLQGTALTIAGGLTPLEQIAAQPSRYPPVLTGLRGQHDGSFETAHQFSNRSLTIALETPAVSETYDLVVVGGGISGLSAAFFYKKANPSARWQSPKASIRLTSSSTWPWRKTWTPCSRRPC